MAGQLTKRENCAVVVHWRDLSPPAWFVRMWHQCELAQNASRVRSLGCSRQDFLPMSISLRDPIRNPGRRRGLAARNAANDRDHQPVRIWLLPRFGHLLCVWWRAAYDCVLMLARKVGAPFTMRELKIVWLVAAVVAVVALEVFLVPFALLYSPPNEVTIQVAP